MFVFFLNSHPLARCMDITPRFGTGINTFSGTKRRCDKLVNFLLNPQTPQWWESSQCPIEDQFKRTPTSISHLLMTQHPLCTLSPHPPLTLSLFHDRDGTPPPCMSQPQTKHTLLVLTHQCSCCLQRWPTYLIRKIMISLAAISHR